MKYYISKDGTRVIETNEYYYFFPVSCMLSWETLVRGINKGCYQPQEKELFKEIVKYMKEIQL